ncbi:hypothetical protein IscW_ISCW006740 [Ixodes scapularis]|uniref:Uncharacterized protein n=1 Tax=Ixodes scapularis TaxID=6945 RepID=B7PKK4_IXOSC|nr:hypothetical protein IscW_ISCW006740 [Ixodes scapularis]|eukprot:XP_002400700.1 hypothetical protein IscW_ISCW006740 [Ixodes scapularis]
MPQLHGTCSPANDAQLPERGALRRAYDRVAFPTPAECASNFPTDPRPSSEGLATPLCGGDAPSLPQSGKGPRQTTNPAEVVHKVLRPAVW